MAKQTNPTPEANRASEKPANDSIHSLTRRKSLYRGVVDAVKQLTQPTVLTPLHVSSMRQEFGSTFGSMEGLYAGNKLRAGALSLGINATIIGLLLLIGTHTRTIMDVVHERTQVLIAPDLRPPVPLKPELQTAGGGGGAASKLPDTFGELPKTAPRVFVPPSANTVESPKLPMASTILSGPDIQISASNLGNPLGVVGVPGLGTGPGIGIGPGKGAGVGPGDEEGFGGKIYRSGNGISQPIAIFKPEPEYSEEGRKARQQGEVLIQIVVDEAGRPRNLQVLRGLGLGLDQKAMEAVAKWIFKPALKDGKPVPVTATVAVTFRLL